jgi:hypothetical protein
MRPNFLSQLEKTRSTARPDETIGTRAVLVSLNLSGGTASENRSGRPAPRNTTSTASSRAVSTCSP